MVQNFSPDHSTEQQPVDPSAVGGNANSNVSLFKKLLSHKWAIISVIIFTGIGFAASWFWQDNHINNSQAVIAGLSTSNDYREDEKAALRAENQRLQDEKNSLESEKKNIQKELEESYDTWDEGDCYDDFNGYYGDCPELIARSAQILNDPVLPEGSYFVLIDLEVSNPNNESLSFDAYMIALKDNNSYVYSQADKIDYGDYYEDEPTEYESLKDIDLSFADQYYTTLAKDEKVRGNLVFKVTRPASDFSLKFSSTLSEPFTAN